MKKRLFCIALCLCLLCTVVASPAMASHTCTDADYDSWCDICDDAMPHYCYTCDSDAFCDICYEVIKHTCMYNDDYAICSKCFETAEHVCVDADEDYYCDRCFDPIMHDCKDSDGDYWCDLCCGWIDHDCTDTDSDYLCDLCYDYMLHDCFDTDGDYYCDVCDYPMDHECVDADGDVFCDICYDILITEDMFTTVSGTAQSGLDNLEPVNIDIYDDQDGYYVNFALLTGDNPEYELLIFPDVSYDIYVSKANHVTRAYKLDVADGPASLDVKICPIGDASGDCKLNMGDVAKIYSHLRNITLLTDDYALDCADVSGDGKLNMGDTAKLYSHLCGINTLW